MIPSTDLYNEEIKIRNKVKFRLDRIKHIKGQVYSVFIDERKYVLKLKEDSSFLKKWKKNIAFRNELSINRQLLIADFKYFNFPKLIDTDGKTYMLFEYIEGSQGIDDRYINDDLLSDSLLEFHMLLLDRSKEKKFLLKNIYEKFLFSPSSSILRGIFLFGLLNCGVIACLKCLIILFKCSISEKSYKYSLLQHRDLGNISNKISGQNGKIYFIDFAGTREENKWILIDIVDIVISRETLEVKSNLFKLYLKKINVKLRRDINIKAQVRVALLRKILHLMGKKGGRYNQISKKFFSEILINDSSFDKWFKENWKI